MIWLVEGKNLVGYAPMLKKGYSVEEVRHMCGVNSSTELAKMLSNMQETRYNMSFLGGRIIGGEERLVDVKFSFDFEFLPWVESNNEEEIGLDLYYIKYDEEEKYLKSIFDVFEKLVLYKVSCFTQEEMQKKVENIKQELEPFMSKRTLAKIEDEAKNLIETAQRTSKNLNETLKMFSDRGYILSHSLFEIPDKEVLEQLYRERPICE